MRPSERCTFAMLVNPPRMFHDWQRDLNALDCPAFVLESAPNITFANRCFYEYTGLQPSEVELQGWPAFVHSDDVAFTQASIAAGIRSSAPFTFRHRLRSASGSYRLYESVFSPSASLGESIPPWLAISRNIDTLALEQTQLAASEASLRAFLDSIPHIVWTADTSGWIDWYNRRWSEFTGQSLTDAQGWGWQDVIHPDDLAGILEQWASSIESGAAFDREFRLAHRDGSYHWMLARVEPLLTEAGTVRRWYGAVTDIDEQKIERLRSREIAERLQDALLTESLPTGPGYRFDAIAVSAERESRIGGDWYDAVELPDGRIVFSIGDVTGHGLAAAAHAARLRQYVAFAAIEDPDPASILARLNAFVVSQNLPIASAAVGIFDPRRMEITYALAGHPPPITTYREHKAVFGSPSGTLIGVGESFSTVTRIVRLMPNAVFALFTDGVTENGRNIEDAERLIGQAASYLASHPSTPRPASVLLERVLGTTVRSDDIAVILIQASSSIERSTTSADLYRKTVRFHASHAPSVQTARRELGMFFRRHAIEDQRAIEAEIAIGETLALTTQSASGIVEIDVDWTARVPFVRVSKSSRPNLPASPISFSAPSNDEDFSRTLLATLTADFQIEATNDRAIFSYCLPQLPRERRAAWRSGGERPSTHV